MARTPEADLHRIRGMEVVRAHPEILRLMQPHRRTLGWMALVMLLQLTVAAWVAQLPWWAVVGAAYTVGALASLALWALLHEATHDLVFRRSAANQWLGIICGLPLVIPSAASFRKCHLLHHRHLGDPVLDGDLASEWECRLVDDGQVRKALWLLFQPLLQTLRPGRMPGVRLADRWLFANFALQAAFDVAVVALFGCGALAYLLLGNMFSLGLHPLGGRWIQEHHVFEPGQPTYSYYGPMNRLMFNCGYHSEHHDLMRIPWVHLPKVRQAAPEFYGTLYSHRSWTGLLVRFVLDSKLTPSKRMPDGGALAAAEMGEAA